MRTCPLCRTSYGDDVEACELDGSLLVGKRPVTATEASSDLSQGSGSAHAIGSADILGSRVVDGTSQGASIDVSIGDSSIVDSGAHLDRPPQRTEAASPSGRVKRKRPDDSRTELEGGTRHTGGAPSMPAPSRKRGSKQVRPEERVGRVLGSYRLLEVIGRGGMGAVYRAEHIKLGRDVALKLLHPQFAKRRDAVARFFQEARAVNRVRHRNIVDITDLVELDDGTVFIIMELLAGESLGRRLRREGAPDIPTGLSVLIQICDALDAAHSVDIVHRDLKPDNIFLTRTHDGAPLVKLLDFGVAKLIGKDRDVGLKTAAGAVVGTPAFMSPEQAGGLEIDHRSDIYALGAIMYELFTGQHVFKGKSFGDFVKKHLTQDPLPPSQTAGGAGMDRRLEAVIMRCLQKSPEARYQSAASMREALLELLRIIASELGGEVMTDSGVYRLSGEFALPAQSTAMQWGDQPSEPPSERPGSRPPRRATNRPGSAPVRAGSSGWGERSDYGAPPGPFTAPPSTLHSEGGPRPGLDTALSMGDLPRDRTVLRGATAKFVIGGSIVAAAVIAIAIALATGGSGGEQSASNTVDDSSADDGDNTDTASDSETAAGQTATGPIVKQIVTPAPRVVRVRFQSDPSGAQVFAVGRALSTCETPCDVTIDLGDGGSPLRRDFVVRLDGYEEAPVQVDLSTDNSTHAVELTKMPDALVFTDDTPGKKVKRGSSKTKRGSSKTKRGSSKTMSGSSSTSAKSETKSTSTGTKTNETTKTGGGSKTISPKETLNPFGNKKKNSSGN